MALKGPENELIAGRPDRALQLSHNLSGEGLKPEEWHRHRLDVALASVRTGDADLATDILHGLRRGSPHWLRYQQSARDITREILATRPRMPNEEQRALGEFMDVEG